MLRWNLNQCENFYIISCVTDVTIVFLNDMNHNSCDETFVRFRLIHRSYVGTILLFALGCVIVLVDFKILCKSLHGSEFKI